MTKPDPDTNPDPDNNSGPANDNDNGRAVAPAPQTGALASAALTALAAMFKTVDTSTLGSRPLHPMLLFRSREGGVWAFGQRRTIPEPDSLWAVNPASYQWGWVCWADNNKVLGEKLVSIGEPLPDVTKLPDRGRPWQEAMAVNMKCVSGVDADTEVVFKTNTVGGRGELLQLIEEVRGRFDRQHDGKVVPVVRLENSSYPHPQFGKTFIPVMPIEDWMLQDGPAPAPKPTAPPPPPPPEQPRRRRVG